MKQPSDKPLVTTIKERCRVCYTCVRECPAKAIRIADGQAEVLPERCIGCGNCVRVCSQHAKAVHSGIEDVRELLASEHTVAAIVAPSFPAEFTEIEPQRGIGLIRRLGFDRVNEVAFGADLVARGYRRLLEENPDKRFIATTCPGVVGFVERYHPELLDSLAPLVSPMVATARALRQLHGPELKVVFIGPCIAKKGEMTAGVAESRCEDDGCEQCDSPGEIDAVLTFAELRQMARQDGLNPSEAPQTDFDPPHGGLGALFPVSRGMLQAADIREDLLAGDVVAADGRTGFVEAIKEFQDGSLDARLLEVLCCSGCISGAGVSSDAPQFRRRSRVSQYVRDRLAGLDRQQWRRDVERFDSLDLTRRFHSNDQRIPVPFGDELRHIMAQLGKFTPEDELNCGACGYETCREHAVAIFKGLAENEMCLPYTIEQLRRTVRELNISNEELANAQEALMQAEKLASMGQLAAGIAHEVNNPLGVVLVYTHLLLEQCSKDSRMRDDLALVAEQADRCKTIVSGLLNFARQNKVVLQETDVTGLIDRVMRAIRAPEGVTTEVSHDVENPLAEVDRDQITQVLTNLVSNAYAAMEAGGTMTIETTGDDDALRIAVSDTGMGIPTENQSKIFEPFFTTKQMGKGTGLGLAVTYGIVKMHRGDICVESNDNPAKGPTGTTFIVTLPRSSRQE